MTTAQPLMGRDPELAELRRLFDEAAAGRGSSLVVRGEAGMGKTALLDALRREAVARDALIITAAGVESECELAYAVLHQALHPLLDRTAGLPELQRLALRRAFGQEDGPADLYTVALAALELITDAAVDRTVVALFDDVHWIDTPSADVLAFIGRRIGGERVFAMGTTRTVSLTDPLRRTGLPELYLRPLDAESAAALLDSTAPTLAAPVRDRLLAEAAGSPLALVELPRVWDGSAVDQEMMPLTTRLETAFAARTAQLGDAARVLLTVLAADVTCDTGRLLAAASTVARREVGTPELQEALDADLVELARTGLRFLHPLMRSAIYSRAPLTVRLDAHTALADQLTDLPDRELWHRASAVLGTDEDMAVRLEAYATRCRSRGALMSAVTGLRRAADLAESGTRRTSLLLHAAELACEVGRRSDAADLAAQADTRLLGPVESGRLAAVQEVVAPGLLGDVRRIRALVEQSGDAREAGDTTLAVHLLWRAASRCWWACAAPDVRQAVADAVPAIGLDPDDPRRLGILAFAQPEVHGREVLTRTAGIAPERARGPMTHFLSSAAVILGDYHRASGYVRAAAAACRDSGQLALLARVLGAGNWGRIWTGEWDLVRTEAKEAARLAEETGDSFWVLSANADLAMLAAQRGESAEAEAVALEGLASPLLKGVGFMHCALQHARGVAALSAGRYEEAFALLRRLYEPSDPAFHDMRWHAAPDLADAARHLGRQDEAQVILGGLEEMAQRLPSPMLRMCRAYVRAVLAPDDTAEQLFKDALAEDVPPWPPYHGRLLLAEGVWLRRRHRAARARESLRAARDRFDALGARHWSERARQELRAAGERSGSSTRPVRETLSAQELQIANLAAEGLTNRQIADRLFLSHRTVGSHLYRIFPKLGITTRAQLGAALGTVLVGASASGRP
ncbi:ATP-binding protein [Streptomyces sp. NPDC052023]|uniref:ATP-binding protein n=1 Tax=Streptomyces sp. NPDC052023 TaxID=3365681 RepID=UPI0037D60F35